MGSIPSKVFNRFFEYPLKMRPCVFGNENFLEADVQDQTEYEKLSDAFSRKLAEKRKERNENREVYSLSKIFTEWTESTIFYLHSLFLTFCDKDKKMLSYKSFECILESLSDVSLTDTRKNIFHSADEDADGYINYLDFLHAVYNTGTSEDNIGLRKLCVSVAEKARLINSLSTERQLECGLF